MGKRERVAHLLRRGTFGPTAEEVDAAEQQGVEVTLSRLMGPPGPTMGPSAPVLPPDPAYSLHYTASPAQKEASYKARREQIQYIIQWWLDRMVANGHQFEEKLTFFWHGHWATSVDKVGGAGLMMLQHNTLREYGRGDFAVFVKAMLRDPALIMWLDGGRNTRTAPNENLARELMELFTLGIGKYTEADVKEAARALTGWTVDRVAGTVKFEPNRFDPGAKTILNQTDNFDADSLTDLLVRQPVCARFLASRLWLRFASEAPIPEASLHRIVARYSSAGRSLNALLTALFEDPEFGNTQGQLVKQPIEWAVGAMRQLRIRPSSLTDADRRQLVNHLEALDQVPFRPPSVGGWPTGVTWLTSQSAQVRLRLAQMFAEKAPDTTMAKLSDAPIQGRTNALARMLVVDNWTERTRKMLDANADDLRKMLALGLITPEYTVH